MGILIDPTLPDRDWSGMVKPTAETVGHLLALSFGDAASSAFESMKTFRTREEEVGQRAWTLWRESLALAFGEFFKTAGLTRQPDDEELKRLLVQILERSASLAEKGEVELTGEDLRNPLGLRLYVDVREKLPGWARQVAPEHLRDDDHLRRRLDRAFVKGFHRARFEGGEHFQPIREYLFGEGSEAIERRDHWLRYYEWLRADVEDRPMFGQNADGPSLQDIFVPLRCTWRERSRERRGREEEAEKRTTVHVRLLLDELQAWLKKADKSDVLRVVTGGPGCGKSSTAKVFSRDVAMADEVNVFLVPLQGLDVSRDIDLIVGDYIDDARHNSSCLPESPVSWMRHDSKPLLLIFDGLDEVARPDGAGLEVTRQFLESLRVWLGRANDGSDLKVMALTLGRPQAAEEAASKIGGLDGPSLLYAEPLCHLEEERLKRGSQDEIVVDDPGNLAKGDDRKRFWDGYARFDSRYGDEEPEVLQEQGFNDLTVEPLLLYLLMYSGLAGKDWPEAKENRNRIYEAIFAKVHERDRTEKAGIAVDERDDFFTLMECLGLAAWLGGGRTGSDANFEYIRDEIYAPDRQKDFENLDRATLKNVAVQFYTHHGGREQPGYAFIHKSFGEYLTARALIKASAAWCEEHAARHRWDRFAADWLRLTGGQRISSEILNFMIDEARLQMKPHSRDEPDMERARVLVEQLCEVPSLTLRDGFPAHENSIHGQNVFPCWRRRERIQRNAEEVLYAVIHAWAEVGYPIELLGKKEALGGWSPGPIVVKWAPTGLHGWDESADGMLRRLGGQLGSTDRGVSGAVLARWSIAGRELNDMFLFGSNLLGTDLSRTSLNWANLSGAKLIGAKLIGANLSGADLSETNLSGADCSRLNIDSARLQSADLSKAVNLTQPQIDKVYGNSETKLPGGMAIPEDRLRD